jgi:hypothetical protein
MGKQMIGLTSPDLAKPRLPDDRLGVHDTDTSNQHTTTPNKSEATATTTRNVLGKVFAGGSNGNLPWRHAGPSGCAQTRTSRRLVGCISSGAALCTRDVPQKRRALLRSLPYPRVAGAGLGGGYLSGSTAASMLASDAAGTPCHAMVYNEAYITRPCSWPQTNERAELI